MGDEKTILDKVPRLFIPGVHATYEDGRVVLRVSGSQRKLLTDHLDSSGAGIPLAIRLTTMLALREPARASLRYLQPLAGNRFLFRSVIKAPSSEDMIGSMDKRVLLVAAAVACASAPPPRPAPEPVRDAPPPAPAAPVDPNAPQPMPVEEFKQLIHTIDLSSTGDQGKIAIIKTAAADNWFIVGEVAMLIDHVTYRQSKLDLIPILNPRTTNRSEAWRLIDKFTYREDKAIVQQQLVNH